MSVIHYGPSSVYTLIKDQIGSLPMIGGADLPRTQKGGGLKINQSINQSIKWVMLQLYINTSFSLIRKGPCFLSLFSHHIYFVIGMHHSFSFSPLIGYDQTIDGERK